jgi:hypothetical protein
MLSSVRDLEVCDFKVHAVWNKTEEKVQVMLVVMRQRGLS